MIKPLTSFAPLLFRQSVSFNRVCTTVAGHPIISRSQNGQENHHALDDTKRLFDLFGLGRYT